MNEEYKQKIIAIRGAEGAKWLEDIPQLIKSYEEKWGIQCLDPFPLSYNYVLRAKTSEGTPAVFKIGLPGDEFISEVNALRFYDGQGAIHVLQADHEKSVVLLEKAEPGTRVQEVVPESKQISLISEVLQKLHKPIASDQFPTISVWADAFANYRTSYSLKEGPVPDWMFEKAEDIFTQYPKENKEQVLLHGDLHTDNILLSERGWLAIDPKGVIGEREFELGACLRNPYYDYPKGSDYKKLETRKILQFSEELGFDRERILNWTFACAVISLVWHLEDEGKLDEIYIRNAELLNEISFL